MLTNKEILTKAILKAENNGWENPYGTDLFTNYNYIYNDKIIHIEWDIKNTIIINNEPIDEQFQTLSIFEIIFSHSFAKAFWGDNIWDIDTKEWVPSDKVVEYRLRKWQRHLQQMVLSPEPLLYLKDYI